MPRKKVMTILIDPGHGGKDCGAIVGNVREKDINLSVAMRVARTLQRAGFCVYLTRTGDQNVMLEERVNFGSRVKADLLISLHCNAAKSQVTGLETYLATRTGDCAIGSAVPSLKSCSANRFDAQNLYLAHIVHRWILWKTKMPDRGIRPMRYYITRNATCPSVLVEMGFMTTPRELAQMCQPARQQAIAEAITCAMIQYRKASMNGGRK